MMRPYEKLVQKICEHRSILAQQRVEHEKVIKQHKEEIRTMTNLNQEDDVEYRSDRRRRWMERVIVGKPGGSEFQDDQLKLFKGYKEAARRLNEQGKKDALLLARKQQAEWQNRLLQNMLQIEKVFDGVTNERTHDKAPNRVIKLESDDDDEVAIDFRKMDKKAFSDDDDQETINSLHTKFALANEKVLDAQKMAVHVLECLPQDEVVLGKKRKLVKPKQATLGVKSAGSIDEGPWSNTFKKKYKGGFWAVEMKQVFSKWEELIRNPQFRPFRLVRIGGDQWKQEIDHKDPKLVSLRAELGEDVYNTICAALLEVKEYNASGQYPVRVAWNFDKSRKASLAEVIAHLGGIIESLVPFEPPAKKGWK